MSLIPSKKIEGEYTDFINEFNESHVNHNQIVVIEEINKILNTLDLGDKTKKDSEGINSWSEPQLLSAETKLSRYSESLGEYLTYHQSRSDFAYIWRKGQYAKDWSITKARIQEKLGKATNTEIESELTDKYIGEQFFSMFHRKRADYLITKMEAIDRMLRTIAHRLRLLDREFKQSNKNN